MNEEKNKDIVSDGENLSAETECDKDGINDGVEEFDSRENNGENEEPDTLELSARKSRKTKRMIITVFTASIVLLIICALVPGLLSGNKDEYKTYPPIDPSKLSPVKDEDFDIMEYDGYLKLDRAVYMLEGTNNSYFKNSIDKKQAAELGEEIALVYEMIDYIICGDWESYNACVSDDLKKQEFTQQQLYDIIISRSRPNEGEDFDFVVKVEYKIHENNGTYRNNIISDASRYQLFCMKRVGGELKVTAIIEPYYEVVSEDAGLGCGASTAISSVAVILTLLCSTVGLKKKEKSE